MTTVELRSEGCVASGSRGSVELLCIVRTLSFDEEKRKASGE